MILWRGLDRLEFSNAG